MRGSHEIFATVSVDKCETDRVEAEMTIVTSECALDPPQLPPGIGVLERTASVSPDFLSPILCHSKDIMIIQCFHIKIIRMSFRLLRSMTHKLTSDFPISALFDIEANLRLLSSHPLSSWQMHQYLIDYLNLQIIQQALRAPMRIDLKDILILFEQIQEEMNISYVSIVIFCAIDVDSLCSLRIFTKLFKSENIQYKIYPVTKYTELYNRIEESQVYEQVKLFLFINCGGIIDLTESEILQKSKAMIFLLDINKPINHKNLESPHIKIKVIDDGCSELENCPTTEEIQKCAELNEYNLDSEDEDFQEEEENSREDSPNRKNRKVFKEKLRKHKYLIEKKIEHYYTHNFFSYPSSYSAYRLVRDLNKSNNDYLWYAIVGMTSMFLDQKLPKEVLDYLSQVYRSDVAKYNQQTQTKEKGEISSKRGYQFTLMDHWSLYESMFYSNYLMARLQLWQDRGLHKLHQFIHNIGISLQEAKQLYKYMPVESQRKLESSIIPSAEKYGLLEVAYMSFVRNVDYTAAFMASDFCYALISVLQAPPKTMIGYKGFPEYHVKCFWEAYDVFDANLKELSGRIESYKKTVKILMTETRNILERDHLITTNTISIANIRSDTEDRKIFQHPSMLIRIAYILMAILRERKKAKSNRPFIANWIDLEGSICLAVGVMMQNKNSIGSKFNKVAEKLKIEVDHDNFMANIIVFHKDHLSQFIKEISRT